MWIARDKSGELHLWFNRPMKSAGKWISNDGDFLIDSELFPEITWEDSEPVEVGLYKINRHYIQCDKCGKAFSYLDSDVETIEICTQPSSPYADEFEIVHCPHCKSEAFL